MRDWIDDDGYPTENALARLATWNVNDVNGAIDFMRELWWAPEWGIRETFTDAEREVYRLDPGRRYVKMSTGGWSGNEDLMRVFRAEWWGRRTIVATRRGGHYVLEYLQ